MRIIAIKTLRSFWQKHPDSEQSLRAWYYEVKKAKWRSFHNVKVLYRHASMVGNDRIIFNIKGNEYRLVTAFKFDFQIVYIRFIGTHKAYDKINAKEI